MEKRLEEPGFWDNPEVSQQVMKELKGLQDSVKEIEKLYTDYEDMLLLIDMSAGEDEEEETAEEVAEELQQFEAVFEQLRISTLLIGPYDRDNAIVTLHAGAGGTEAMDWTGIADGQKRRGMNWKYWIIWKEMWPGSKVLPLK